ncbi:hypothetical protein SAMN06264855_11314 [Halorubrum vacuolatum]|uniref:Uncharacterized protein n=2 Tax=Halorubrum vacuolatum TaxID=63740 RepID=A0A238X5Y5_HALVU|nr:hypothetical protein SAMN06264855_11314 [Halorubrum vacuolatum]
MIAKSIEAAVVILFIGVVTSGLYAGVIPEYRSVTAAEVGDRTLATAGHEIERAVPPKQGGTVLEQRTERRVSLPATIRAEPYHIVPDEGASRIELRHPHRSIGGSRALSLPEHVVEIRGELPGGEGWIVVTTAPEGDGVIIILGAEPTEAGE